MTPRSRRRALLGALALTGVVVLLLAGASTAFGRYDPYDGHAYHPAEQPYAPYTVVPVLYVSEPTYAPYTEATIGDGPKDEHRWGHFPID